MHADEQGRVATIARPQPSIRPRDPREQVGEWFVTWFDGEGKTRGQKVTGKLVIQEHAVLVMHPDTKAIIWACPSANAGPVEPA